jgi:hypothetical protein
MAWPKTRQTEYIDLPKPILIVCEDKKSAVYYLKDKVKSLRLHYAQVLVDGNSGSAPISVVNYAIEKKEEQKDSKSLPFDKIYCVMDVDNHTSLKKAINKAKANGLIPIISNESFELWYLLHFIDYSTASLPRKAINRLLAGHLGSEYNKGDKGIYEKIYANEGKAWQSAKLLYKHAIETSDQRDPLINPSTEVHILLAHLHKISGVKDPTLDK